MRKYINIIFIFFVIFSVEAKGKSKVKSSKPGEYPKISAKYAAIYDLSSGVFLFEKDADAITPPASTVKLLTAMVVLDNLEPKHKIKVPKSVKNIEPYKLYLRQGETYTVKELLYALLLRSANDVAHTLAIGTCGSEKKFAKLLNQKAKNIGAKHSNFCNSSGLPDPKQVVTVRDMVLITAYVQTYPLLNQILQTKTKIFVGPGRRVTKLVNRNKLLISGFSPTIAGKTGYTIKAGRCFTGYLTDINTPFIISLFKTSKKVRWNDLRALVKWSVDWYKKQINLNKKIVEFSTIIACQKRLRELGFLQDKADGVFGYKTLSAILSFQKFKNLKPDGILTGKTRDYLIQGR